MPQAMAEATIAAVMVIQILEQLVKFKDTGGVGRTAIMYRLLEDYAATRRNVKGV